MKSIIENNNKKQNTIKINQTLKNLKKNVNYYLRNNAYV